METLNIKRPEQKKPEPHSSPLHGAEGVTGSVALLEAFIAEEVETIFGYPGGAILPIYDALYDYNDKLEHILVRHE
ncbi:MAG: thiamine pyrophosphate-binding protein, partial [Bacteroidota bacterium]